MKSATRLEFSLAAKLAVALILLIQLAGASESNQDGPKADEALAGGKRDDSVMGTLIDWRTYTRAFNKKYSSLTQQLVRNKLFILNTMKVFLTATKYKFNKVSYYLVINRYSDMTPEEERHKLSGDGGEYPSDDEAEDDEIMDDEQIERVLRADLEDQLDEPAGERRLSQPKPIIRRRRKRDASETQVSSTAETHRPGGELAIDDLVRIPDAESQNQAYAGFNIKWVVPSNNPDYVPVEALTFGASSTPARKQVDDIPKEQIEKIDKDSQGYLSFRMPSLDSLGAMTKKTYNWISQGAPEGDEQSSATAVQEAPDKPEKPPNSDVVIKDWRGSGCVSTPYDQGDCNSCYAVSSMSFIEWAFCMNQNRVLTPLSAQYFVSCGPQYMSESDPKLKIEFYGCNKGRSRQAMHFVKDYGVELAAHMPYLAEDTGCPVDPDTPLKHKGYIRPNIKQHVRMSSSTKQLELALNVGPVIVNFREPIDFMAYGGGMVGDCYQRGGHAMLIVGHGIENDIPYLIIKNSFGSDWGMNGYFKFNREFTQACIKDFILPRVSFPSKKAQVRRMKAYDASKAGSKAKSEEAGNFEIYLNKLADS